jgi:hypothetical protein
MLLHSQFGVCTPSTSTREKMHRRESKQCETALGKEHPDKLSSMNQSSQKSVQSISQSLLQSSLAHHLAESIHFCVYKYQLTPQVDRQ